jgi:hypothetical protein
MVCWKNAGEASSKVGEFVRLTTTPAPASACGRPAPVSRSTPVDSPCGTAWCPSAVRISTTCDPIRPVPPMTAIFMSVDPFWFPDRTCPGLTYEWVRRARARGQSGREADGPLTSEDRTAVPAVTARPRSGASGAAGWSGTGGLVVPNSTSDCAGPGPIGA